VSDTGGVSISELKIVATFVGSFVAALAGLLARQLWETGRNLPRSLKTIRRGRYMNAVISESANPSNEEIFVLSPRVTRTSENTDIAKLQHEWARPGVEVSGPLPFRVDG